MSSYVQNGSIGPPSFFTTSSDFISFKRDRTLVTMSPQPHGLFEKRQHVTGKAEVEAVRRAEEMRSKTRQVMRQEMDIQRSLKRREPPLENAWRTRMQTVTAIRMPPPASRTVALTDTTMKALLNRPVAKDTSTIRLLSSSRPVAIERRVLQAKWNNQLVKNSVNNIEPKSIQHFSTGTTPSAAKNRTRIKCSMAASEAAFLSSVPQRIEVITGRIKAKLKK
ncbi:hypothetical protein BC829DRAFT_379231 [Chytridium lagenaria]|nr:hypothetical protein BC829DRAFT_379231 [Chytridium lagenaria]